MLKVVEAVRLDGPAGDGRTEPLRAGALTDAGHPIDVYLKLPGRHLQVEGLMNEALAACMAAELGLPMPSAYLVRIDPAFVAATPSPAVRARLANCPLAFGLQDLSANWRKWNTTNKLHPGQHTLALQVLAFDAFIGNSDRSPVRPNLMFSPRSGDIALIDHESAYGFRMKLFPRVEPWTLGNLNTLARVGQESEHLFFAGLRRQAPLDFGSIDARWARLDDSVLATWEAALPMEWRSALPALQEALAHIATVRDRMPACLTELERVLSC